LRDEGGNISQRAHHVCANAATSSATSSSVGGITATVNGLDGRKDHAVQASDPLMGGLIG